MNIDLITFGFLLLIAGAIVVVYCFLSKDPDTKQDEMVNGVTEEPKPEVKKTRKKAK